MYIPYRYVSYDLAFTQGHSKSIQHLRVIYYPETNGLRFTVALTQDHSKSIQRLRKIYDNNSSYRHVWHRVSNQEGLSIDSNPLVTLFSEKSLTSKTQMTYCENVMQIVHIVHIS